MKKILFSLLCLLPVVLHAQLLSWTPSFIKEVNTSNVVITMDANKGNQGLLNFATPNAVWLHLGVITNKSTSSSNWKYVLTTWPATTPGFSATSLGNNKYSFTLNNSNLRTYFNITDPTEKIVKIAILFRDAPGNLKQANSDGSDMYIPVDTTGSLKVKFVNPPTEPRYIPWVEPITTSVGQNLNIKATSSINCNLSLSLNGTNIGNTTNIDSIVANPVLNQACNNLLVVTGTSGTVTASDTLNFFVNSASPIAALPAGVRDGINYHPGDTSVTLVLLAPNKSSVAVLGSFNNWVATCNSIMNKTPDGLRYWIKINGLTPGVVNKFQYLVDGTIITTDPYCEMVLDPWNDQYINAVTYPNLPSYPASQSGIVGTFQTAAPAYIWTTNNYVRPDKKSLTIYELLIRDWTTEHSFQSVIDSLDYLKRLGINCIELMPVNEFDGNESWGYNPAFYFAIDKYYGTKNSFKKLVDIAHSKGIAIVVDAVLNHVTGASPLAKLYWDGTTNKPASNNPWLNVDAKHDFNVFNDFNHQSTYTKQHVYRYMEHWLKELKVDGFRWDLSKGFTQNNTLGNIGAWSAYDPSRIAIWKQYYDTMQTYSAGAYCIMEHLGVDQEESELANYGMITWGKMTSEYATNSKGYTTGSDGLDRAYYKNRNGYNVPGLISYAESHDEERSMYENLKNGNSSQTAHNVKDLNTALKRQEGMHLLLLMIPGPKMFWQFEELGYDYSINTCVGNSAVAPLSATTNTNCRLDNKPIKWNYYTNANRKNLYNVIAKLNALRNDFPKVFSDATISAGSFLGSSKIKKINLTHTDLNIVSGTNCDVVSQTGVFSFPTNGWWYNYFTSDSINITNLTSSINLAPGDYRLFTSKRITPYTTPVGIAHINFNEFATATLAPNPANKHSNIMLNIIQSGMLDIQILDITGKLVQDVIHTNVGVGDLNIELTNLANLKAGLYFVNIQLNGVKQTLRLVKE
jgi:glycosidase